MGSITCFQLTVLGMNHPDEQVALQAVEFWSTVCEEEIDLAIEAADVCFCPLYWISSKISLGS